MTILGGAALVLAGFVAFGYIQSPDRRHIRELDSGVPNRQIDAIGALERIGSNRGAKAVSGAVSDSDAGVATHAVYALGRMGRPGDLPRVQAALTDPRQPVRAAAVYAISGFGERADVDMLIALLADRRQPPKIRAAAARSLGRLKAFRAMPSLIDALADPSVLVRGRAYAAFRQIAGAAFRFRAADPPERRREAIARIRAAYPRLKTKHDNYLKLLKDRAGGTSQ